MKAQTRHAIEMDAMKPAKTVSYSVLLALTVLVAGCGESLLEPEVFSETASENTLESLEGFEAVLYGAHANLAMVAGNQAAQQLTHEEIMTDVGFATAGAIANWASNFQDFILDGVGSNMYGATWREPYRAIRNANLILENIEDASFSDEQKDVLRAEAHFIRGAAYYKLYRYYGPVPLRTSSDQELEIPRAPEQEYLDFMESELLAAIEGLPPYGQEKAYGRAHEAAAMGYLMRMYLNTKQWQKAADTAQDIIDLNTFELFPSYFGLFQVSNEGNNEIIWARTAKADLGRSANISFMNFAWPTGFRSHPRTGLEFCDGCRNFATMFRIRDPFWYSFEPGDERTSLMIEEYVNDQGELINLLPPNDNVRPFKYWPGDDFAGPGYGNDIPDIRYADVLLTRAEALNELRGPNQESIDLINRVRKPRRPGGYRAEPVPVEGSAPRAHPERARVGVLVGRQAEGGPHPPRQVHRAGAGARPARAAAPRSPSDPAVRPRRQSGPGAEPGLLTRRGRHGERPHQAPGQGGASLWCRRNRFRGRSRA